MRIVVTGGAGFVGSHVVAHLHQNGHEILVVDNLSTGQIEHVPAGVALFEEDVNAIASRKKVTTFMPDALVHLAGQNDAAYAKKKPVFDATSNIMGTVKMLQAARDGGVRTFVFASSASAIYGQTGPMPASEAMRPNPVNPHGISNWCAEQYVNYFGHRSDSPMRCVSLRLGCVYGPRENEAVAPSVISIFAQQMMQRQQVPQIFGDGEHSRDFIYVKDVALAIDRAIDTPVHGTFNIASGQSTRLLDVATLLREITGYAGPLEHRPAREGDARCVHLSIEKAKAQLGWRPITGLRAGLCATADDFLSDASLLMQSDDCEDVEMAWAE